jgi:hypothetical protein
MPTGLGRSPRVQKGAIVFYQLPDLLPNLIAFQCNPDEVIHSLQGRAAGGGGRGDADQINGPPEETFSFTVEIDATDQLEQPGQNALAVDAGFLSGHRCAGKLLHPSANAAPWLPSQSIVRPGSAAIAAASSWSVSPDVWRLIGQAVRPGPASRYEETWKIPPAQRELHK